MNLKRVVTSLLSFLLASTVAFGFAVGAVAFVAGGTALPAPVEPFTSGFGLEMGLYGAFHWALIAIFTLPISVIPLVALMLAVRRRPALAVHRRDSTVLILVLAALGMALRAAVLERPTLLSSPSAFCGSILFTMNSFCEFVGFAVGLLAAAASGNAKGDSRRAVPQRNQARQ